MITDTILLHKARRMDRDALAEIFDIYAPALFGYAVRCCNDKFMADNIVGDAFSKLLEHLSAGNGPKINIRTYLFATAHHLIVEKTRNSHRRLPIETVEVALPDGYSHSVGVENWMLFETVQQAIINDLTDDQRHVIVLRFFEGFGLKETAMITRIRVGNVKVIQYRAIAVLRRVLDYKVGGTEVVPVVNTNPIGDLES